MREQEDELSRGDTARKGALLQRLLAGTIQRWGIIVLVALLSTVIVGLYSITRPSQYRSGGKLFVRPGSRDFVSEGAFSGAGNDARVASSREAINNEMQVLGAPAFFELAVEKVGAETVLSPFDPNRTLHSGTTWYRKLILDLQSWWFSTTNASSDPTNVNAVVRTRMAREVLSHSVIVVPEAGASVISCYYFSHSPELAQNILNGVLEAATEMHGRVFNNIAGADRLRDELKIVEERARTAEKALRDFRSQNGIFEDYSEQLASMQAYRDQINIKLNEAAVATALLQVEQDVLKESLKTTPETRIAPGSVASVLNPEYSALTDEIKLLRQALFALSQDRSTTPTTKEQRTEALEARVREVETHLAQTPIARELGGYVEAYPDYVRITDRLRVVELELKKLDREHKEYKSLHKNAGVTLDKLMLAGPDLKLLELEAAQYRHKADNFASGISQLQAVQRLDQLNLSSVRVIQAATYEPDGVSLGRTRILLMGMLGGTFAGMALALLLAFFDGRVRSRADLILCGVPRHGVMRSIVDAEDSPKPWGLPHSLAIARSDIDRFWKSVPFDCREREGVAIAFVPCGSAPVDRAASSLAIGLATHCGERVAYVCLTDGQTWLSRHIAVKSDPGWRDHIMTSDVAAIDAYESAVPGLHFYGDGESESSASRVVAGPGLVALLDHLRARHRFVILELPNPENVASADAALGAVDAVMFVARRNHVFRAQVGEAVERAAAAGARVLGAILQDKTDSAESDPANRRHANS